MSSDHTNSISLVLLKGHSQIKFAQKAGNEQVAALPH